MSPVARILSALVLLAITAFTVYGFMATFEPPGFLIWRIIYSVIGLLSLGAAGWMLFKKTPSR